jgi:hypothetical protein
MTSFLFLRLLATPWIILRTLTWIAQGELDPWGMPPALVVLGNLTMLAALLFFIWEPYIRQWRRERADRRAA